MSAGHAHTTPVRTAAARHRRRLVWTLVLTGLFLLIEVIGGLVTGSLALLADAGHMLTDVGGLGLALFAIWVAAKPATPEKTYGFYRVEILATLNNAVALLAISTFILYEAYHRFLSPPVVLAGPMLAVAVAGLAVNLGGLWLLRDGSGESLNLRGAYLEVLSDALGSVGVIVAGLVVLATGWTLADPIVAAGIGLFILPRTWSLLSRAVNILLEGTPPHVNLAEVEQAMLEVAGVRQVHDLHVWTLTSGKEAMSAHVHVENLADGDQILRHLHRLLHDRFGIEHTTIQLESGPLVQIVNRSSTSSRSRTAHEGPLS